MLKTDPEICALLPELLLPWYEKNKRDLPWRENTDPYRVLVSEIMLQQTRVEAAKEHYLNFIAALPTVEALAACPKDKLFKLWEGLGYYSRAENLQKAAKQIVAAGGFPRTFEGLRALAGVGVYTAGAIASIAFSLPVPAVDGNVVRVLSRLFGDEREQAVLRSEYTERLAPVYPPQTGDSTQSLMELGATVCTPRSPKCVLCPLFAHCRTKSDALPRRKAKTAKKKSDVTVYLLLTPKGVALERRKEGVLKGMWQFPNDERAVTEEELPARLAAMGIASFTILPPRTHRHVFTHLEWNMTAYPVKTDSAPPRFCYFSAEDIEKNAALPSAFRWCLPLVEERNRR